jgi:sensor histidine kinase YesM
MFLFPALGSGVWRLSPGTMEVVSLSALISFVTVMHLLLQKRALRQLSADIDVEKGKTREAELARQLVEAKLAALQAQIEPHFLYNTLANVQYLVAHDAAAAEEMLSHLIMYLKKSVPKMRGQKSTLEQAFSLSESYLEIMRIRLGDRLTAYVALPASLRSLAFPPTIVQTLVENAVKHGIERKPGPVHVAITARASGNQVRIEVADDGVGFGGAISGSGLGLKNVRERLRALYGETAKLILLANQPSGVRARIEIPYVTSFQ